MSSFSPIVGFSTPSRRALIVEPSGNLWGSERVLLDFLNAATQLPQLPWEIGVCCPPRTPILDSLADIPVDVMPVFESGLHLQKRHRRLLAVARLWHAGRKFRPDLIYVNQAGATRIALLVGLLLRVPVITHIRLAEDAPYILALGAGRRGLPIAICISHYIRSLFEEAPGGTAFAGEQLQVLYDPYTITQDWNTQTEFINQPEVPLFGCIGRMDRNKGQDILLEAIGSLKRSGTYAHAVLVGAPGTDKSFGHELQHRADDLDITEQLSWPGFQNDVFPFLSGCVAQVIPSHVEALGRVVFEAWDAGTIPIAYVGSGGLAEVIKASNGGLLYEEQSAKSLAEAMRHAMRMSTYERTEMIERGRAWMRLNCDPQAYTKSMLTLWEEMVKK